MEYRFSEDKPGDCSFCYYWNDTGKRCGRKNCYYILPPEKEEVYPPGDCRGCCYGKYRRCIGYCTVQILNGLRERRKMDAGRS
jgi:hypothetical protein